MQDECCGGSGGNGVGNGNGGREDSQNAGIGYQEALDTCLKVLAEKLGEECDGAVVAVFNTKTGFSSGHILVEEGIKNGEVAEALRIIVESLTPPKEVN